MKKIFVILSILLTFLLVGFFIMNRLIRGRVENFNQKVPFDNSCKVDADCVLVKLEFECKETCLDYLIDYAEKEYVSVNKNNFYGFSRQWHDNNCKKTKLNSLMCPTVMPRYENTNYKAICKDNVCQKTY
jgi:hypothetical protein